jgi:hypothetical protein
MIAAQFIAYVDANFGDAGECDLRDFANAVCERACTRVPSQVLLVGMEGS